jgi:hypothetical protein
MTKLLLNIDLVKFFKYLCHISQSLTLFFPFLPKKSNSSNPVFLMMYIATSIPGIFVRSTSQIIWSHQHSAKMGMKSLNVNSNFINYPIRKCKITKKLSKYGPTVHQSIISE